jgi:hypothetical protein
LDYYSGLEETVAAAGSELKVTYSEDGLFEFSAFVTPEVVRVRSGIFRDDPFEPPYANGTPIEPAVFLAIWRSIAAAIVKASE